MLRWSVLAAALVVNLPGLWQALVVQNVPVEPVLWHVVVTVPIVTVLLAFPRLAGRPDQRHRQHTGTRP